MSFGPRLLLIGKYDQKNTGSGMLCCETVIPDALERNFITNRVAASCPRPHCIGMYTSFLQSQSS